MKYAGTNIEIHDPMECLRSLQCAISIGLPVVLDQSWVAGMTEILKRVNKESHA